MLAIAAVGFTMQFAVTDVLNLAYGAVMIASAFVAYALNQAGVNVWIALLAGAAAGAAGSVLLNSGIYTPFQRRAASFGSSRAPITLVIVSLGMTLIIEFGLQAIVGGTSVSYTMSQGPTVRAGGLILTTVQLVIIGLSVVVMLGVHGLLRYTKLGKAMRATAANRSLARNCGIRTNRVVTATWALTSSGGELWLSLATRQYPLGYVLNLKLTNPADAANFADRFDPGGYTSNNGGLYVIPWQMISHQDGLLMAHEQKILLVGSWLLALLAVGSLAIVVGGRMAEQNRRVGLLKAVGATPALVAGVLLAEYLALAVIAGAAGSPACSPAG